MIEKVTTKLDRNLFHYNLQLKKPVTLKPYIILICTTHGPVGTGGGGQGGPSPKVLGRAEVEQSPVLPPPPTLIL